MFVNNVKQAPRFAVSIFAAVVLLLLAVGLAAASLLGLSMVIQGWATNPTNPATSINGPASP